MLWNPVKYKCNKSHFYKKLIWMLWKDSRLITKQMLWKKMWVRWLSNGRNNHKSLRGFCTQVASRMFSSYYYMLKKAELETVDCASWLWFMKERLQSVIHTQRKALASHQKTGKGMDIYVLYIKIKCLWYVSFFPTLTNFQRTNQLLVPIISDKRSSSVSQEQSYFVFLYVLILWGS